MAIEFDVNAALDALRAGQDLTGENGFLTPLIKQLTEAALKAELEQHLQHDPQPNRKNGVTRKTLKATTGSFELDTPRDRAGRFVPKLVKKNQTHLTDEIERKIVSLFAHGVSYQSIREHIQELYGLSIPNGTLNAITDKLLPELNACRGAISSSRTAFSTTSSTTTAASMPTGLQPTPTTRRSSSSRSS